MPKNAATALKERVNQHLGSFDVKMYRRVSNLIDSDQNGVFEYHIRLANDDKMILQYTKPNNINILVAVNNVAIFKFVLRDVCHFDAYAYLAHCMKVLEDATLFGLDAQLITDALNDYYPKLPKFNL
jgi:hypothetical protein